MAAKGEWWIVNKWSDGNRIYINIYYKYTQRERETLAHTHIHRQSWSTSKCLCHSSLLTRFFCCVSRVSPGAPNSCSLKRSLMSSGLSILQCLSVSCGELNNFHVTRWTHRHIHTITLSLVHLTIGGCSKLSLMMLDTRRYSCETLDTFLRFFEQVMRMICKGTSERWATTPERVRGKWKERER